jgi:hypothetical protein
MCAMAVIALGGCSGCGGPPSQLVVEGRYGYLRCASLEPGRQEPWESQGLRLSVSERTLSVGASDERLELAVIAGPGPGPAASTLASLRAALERRPADVVVMLGGLGDTENSALATLRGLAGMPTLSLLMGGGRDDGEVWQDAFDELTDAELASVVDARGLRALRFGGSDLMLWSGGPEGRYARTRLSCGFDGDEVEERLHAVDDVSVVGLISWTAPAGVGFGLAGLDVGSESLAASWQSLGNPLGVFAWPAVLGELAPEEGGASSYFVQRLEGLPALRADGTPARGRVLRFTWEAGRMRPVSDAP